jgi:hypothetical protein
LSPEKLAEALVANLTLISVTTEGAPETAHGYHAAPGRWAHQRLNAPGVGLFHFMGPIRPSLSYWGLVVIVPAPCPEPGWEMLQSLPGQAFIREIRMLR